MKCILSAINQAAPRAQDLYAYPHAKRDKDTPSNIGRKVVLRGLVSRQDLNGCYASIIEEPRCRCLIVTLLTAIAAAHWWLFVTLSPNPLFHT